MAGKRIDHIKKALAFILSFILLTGCGGGFVDLSEDESKQIVNYSTNVLSDHNSAVKGSLKNLTKTDLRDIVVKDDPSLVDEIEKLKEEATSETEKPKTSPADSSSSPSDEEEDENSPIKVENADIASIIGLEGFSISYLGHDILESYPEQSESGNQMVFSIEPATANDKLLILYFDVTNTGAEDAECNILALQPRFRFSSGGKIQSFLTTLLLDDLTTLSLPLAAGESTRAVLAAEISNEKAAELSDLTLLIKGEEGNTEILLEKMTPSVTEGEVDSEETAETDDTEAE